MQMKLKQYTEIVMSDPAVKSLNADTGGGAENRGQMEGELKPIAKRKVTVYQVIERLRPKLAVVAGATPFLRLYQDITVGGRVSSSRYQYTLTSENLVDLLEWSPRVEAVMKQLPELSDISSDQQTPGLQASLVIDRDTASRLSLPSSAVCLEARVVVVLESRSAMAGSLNSARLSDFVYSAVTNKYVRKRT